MYHHLIIIIIVAVIVSITMVIGDVTVIYTGIIINICFVNSVIGMASLAVISITIGIVILIVTVIDIIIIIISSSSP